VKPRGADPAFGILERLRQGESAAGMAGGLPNRAHGGEAVGLSERTVETLARSGMRSLLSCIVMRRRPEGMPEGLWPPHEVREDVRGRRAEMGDRAGLRVLRSWVEGSWTAPDTARTVR
jgi:hypothetical protein